MIDGTLNEVALLKPGAILVGHLAALLHPEDVKAYAGREI